MLSNANVVKTIKSKPNKSFKETRKNVQGNRHKASAKRQWQLA